MRMAHSSDRLIDAMVELLARLHLAGLFWGDCSLSNTLFSPDAGTMAAYLVDAETAELHPSLSRGQRAYDVEMAAERVGGELMDLEFGGLLPDDVDPVVIAEEIPKRYEALWQELTREEVFTPEEQRYRVAPGCVASTSSGSTWTRSSWSRPTRAPGFGSRPASRSPAITVTSCSG